ncbi:Histone chaperone domain CHZ [Colletotrichum higginsianum IMI 349063]|uniref:Histone chaperone domain CHZ n=6 Tax=Colletotrichum destructivum species complex TaxID=2707350 RepID=A0A1B7XV36_COLHI|nr:Histone chaperone domain CHZ [Colletotrichum higginsianum IMI 349063]OBR03600.1 Histone chaperone domain CHZ [Colletotrichum higginsianum IMI 349063]TIC97285.1 Histone H2A.Z-specific chaperone CHZ1 [Colletotrichum higginsianum]TQN72559.1 Histone H2A.Z-specific chaperone CHZ1 [Colletotrichum shisoi]GJD02054.1 histone chaperone domain CHZ [Colletotrichum higginsianum]
MAAENENIAAAVPEETKGKGKAVAAEEPVEKSDAMEEDEESSDEEENTEVAEAVEEEDGMEEIDLNNIVEGGRRTRGRVIDFAKAAEENPAEDDEDDEDDDFQAPDDSRMDED